MDFIRQFPETYIPEITSAEAEQLKKMLNINIGQEN